VSEILLGSLVFAGVIMTLVLGVLLARRWLAPAGEVAIRVNEKEWVGARGERLLDAFSRQGLHLPAACGGKGTCGQCVVHVVAGGGQALPTERARLTPGEIGRGLRLACQLVVREPLAVRVHEELLGVREWQCRVRSTRFVGTLMKEIVFDLPEGETLGARAGSYVQVRSQPYDLRFADLALEAPVRAEWERLGLLALEASGAAPTTRAYSLANLPSDDDCAVLVVRIATPPSGAPPGTPPGVVSSYLFSLVPGDSVSLAGPFGHFFANESDAEMIFVGGGAGMAPMRAHIHDQLTRRRTDRNLSFWYGARSRRELFYVEEFEALAAAHANFRFVVALSEPRPEDDWSGELGFVHEVLLRRHLDEHPAPEACEYYLCGPPLMLRATRAMLDRLGVPPENVRFDDFGA
jgi:Na+-transporting NADH:ubiquinone oxidoreductase subunit F